MKTRDYSERTQYIDRVFAKESCLMKEMAKSLELDEKAIQVSPYEGKILEFLIRLAKPINVVEIGSLYGYSLCWILEAVGPEAKVWAVEKSKENFEKSISFLNEHNKRKQVQLQHSSGLDFFKNWDKSKKIDFLFIDADKGNYLNYLEAAKPFLSKGALVVGDNTFLFGHVLKDEPPENYSKNTWEKMRKFNAILAGETGEFEGMMVPTLQGMSVGTFKGA